MAEKKSILVVDDESQIIKFIEMNLEDAGFRVISATNGYQALKRLLESYPTLSFLIL